MNESSRVLERVFQLGRHQTSVRREFIAGITTFAAMAYILAVNPGILGQTGMDRGALITATALASALMTLVMALAIWLSGGLHLDGAMDTADGLAAGDRCLEAMRDSRVGASGVQALVVLLLLRAAALVTLAAAAPWALVWASVWGRIAPLVAMGGFPYLRDQPGAGDSPGPGGSAGFHRRHWAGFGKELLPALLVLGLLGPWSAAAGLPWQGWLGLVPAVLVPWGLGRRLGGHSGDSYGACVEWTCSWTLLLMALGLVLAP